MDDLEIPLADESVKSRLTSGHQLKYYALKGYDRFRLVNFKAADKSSMEAVKRVRVHMGLIFVLHNNGDVRVFNRDLKNSEDGLIFKLID